MGYLQKLGLLKFLCFLTLLIGSATVSYARCSLSSSTLNKCGVNGGCGYTRERCINADSMAVCSPDSTCACSATTCNLSGGRYACVSGACTVVSVDVDPDNTTGGVTTDSAPGMHPYQGKIIKTIPALLGPVAQLLYYVGLLGGVLAIIYSGYLFITSAGEPRSLEEAKAWLSSAVFGLLFIILTRVFMRIIFKQILGSDPGF